MLAGNDSGSFPGRAMIHFGETAECLMNGYAAWPLMQNIRSVWKSALAAEALLFEPNYRQNTPPFSGFVTDDAHPFGAHAPEYGVLKRYPAAAALFPLHGKCPRIGRIWAFGTNAGCGVLPEVRLGLEGEQQLLEEAESRQIRLYAENCGECTGDSWQLAAYLCSGPRIPNRCLICWRSLMTKASITISSSP